MLEIRKNIKAEHFADTTVHGFFFVTHTDTQFQALSLESPNTAVSECLDETLCNLLTVWQYKGLHTYSYLKAHFSEFLDGGETSGRTDCTALNLTCNVIVTKRATDIKSDICTYEVFGIRQKDFGVFRRDLHWIIIFGEHFQTVVSDTLCFFDYRERVGSCANLYGYALFESNLFGFVVVITVSAQNFINPLLQTLGTVSL